jgi:digeranylgeranylglycerophospholipid reductase
MKKYDVIIVGAATTGSYFARRMTERGYKVLVIDKSPRDKIGNKYDIFHIGKPDFERFNLPYPEKDKDMAFEFTGGAAYSAYDNYPKSSESTTIGMHMHKYTLRLNDWAIEAGADYIYEATFKELLYNASKQIIGLTYEKENEEFSVHGKIISDCSGIPSVVRTKLPDDYGVENFKITPIDMFYVILRYVHYLDEKDYVKRGRSWTYFKTWEAPQADPHGAILGVGANFNFEYAETIFESFEKTIPLPRYELQYKEHGTTPYRRPPYSFVADGFIAMGDSACLTKPHAGEGVTSSMVQIDIAVDVIDQLLQANKELSRINLWSINKRYVDAQGKIYAGILATLVGAVSTSAKENEFFFRKDIVFTKKSFDSMWQDKPLVFTFSEMVNMALKMLGGILSGHLKMKTIKTLLKGMKNSERIQKLYATYPAKPDNFEKWVKTADALWKECGSMADHKAS